MQKKIINLEYYYKYSAYLLNIKIIFYSLVLIIIFKVNLFSLQIQAKAGEKIYIQLEEYREIIDDLEHSEQKEQIVDWINYSLLSSLDFDNQLNLKNIIDKIPIRSERIHENTQLIYGSGRFI